MKHKCCFTSLLESYLYEVWHNKNNCHKCHKCPMAITMVPISLGGFQRFVSQVSQLSHYDQGDGNQHGSFFHHVA